MLVPIIFSAVVATLSLDGQLADDGSDYAVVEFEVPAGIVQIDVEHTSLGPGDILDWGLWGPGGFRGWGGGLTDPATVGATASSRGYLPGPIEAGTWQVVIGKAKIDSWPAAYELMVTLSDAETLSPSERAPYGAAALARDGAWYAGDLHVHSRESGDAVATFDQIAQLARDRGLDFVAVSDHNTVSQLGLIAAFQQGVDDVLLLRAAEVTTYGGHGNAFGISDYVDHRVGLDGRTATEIVDDVKAQGAVFSINHPALDLGTLCLGCAWIHEDTPWDRVDAIEIHTGPFEQVAGIFTPRAIEMWDERLDAGHRLTAVGGSDDHRAGMDLSSNQSPIGSPTTLVYARELSEAAILDGLREGRAIVKLRGPDDPMLEIFAVAPDGARGMIGDTVAGAETEIEVHAVGASGLEVSVVRDGEPVELAAVDSDDWTGRWTFPTDEGGSRYRAHLLLGALSVVVTNHVYVDHAPPADGGGCGCRAGGRSGGGALALAIAAIGLAASCRHRRNGCASAGPRDR